MDGYEKFNTCIKEIIKHFKSPKGDIIGLVSVECVNFNDIETNFMIVAINLLKIRQEYPLNLSI